MTDACLQIFVASAGMLLQKLNYKFFNQKEASCDPIMSYAQCKRHQVCTIYTNVALELWQHTACELVLPWPQNSFPKNSFLRKTLVLFCIMRVNVIQKSFDLNNVFSQTLCSCATLFSSTLLCWIHFIDIFSLLKNSTGLLKTVITRINCHSPLQITMHTSTRWSKSWFRYPTDLGTPPWYPFQMFPFGTAYYQANPLAEGNRSASTAASAERSSFLAKSGTVMLNRVRIS